MLKSHSKWFINQSLMMSLIIGAGLLSVVPVQAADKITTRKQKSAEWKRRQNQIRSVERRISLNRKEYEMLRSNEETFKILLQTVRDGNGETATPSQREEAKKSLATLEKFSGPLGAKYDDNGVLLNADSIETTFYEKVKRRKVSLSENEQKLIQRQKALMNKKK